jgi:hypothetical protein
MWPISGGLLIAASFKHLPPDLRPVRYPFWVHISVYSSNEFFREIFEMEFASQAWYVEFDFGKPKPAAGSHQTDQHIE